jgi:hypothetical protein
MPDSDVTSLVVTQEHTSTTPTKRHSPTNDLTVLFILPLARLAIVKPLAWFINAFHVALKTG